MRETDYLELEGNLQRKIEQAVFGNLTMVSTHSIVGLL